MSNGAAANGTYDRARMQVPGPERRTTRGQIVRRAAVGAAAGMVASGCRSQRSATAARDRDGVVVVGAGVAGLTCAYRLLQHGIHASVYEASERVGGRTRTLRGFFADGQIVEQGGEAIDTDQHAVRRLVAELGLRLDDTFADTPGSLTSNRFEFHRRRYTYARASRDFAAVYPALQRDLRAFARSPRAARELDEMSAADWIGSRVPGGNGSQLGRLIGEAYCSEDGVPIEAGSALAMITQLGESAKRPLSLYGDSDERFKVHGGADQIARRLARRLPAGAIAVGMPLVGLRRNADRSYTCAFAGGRVVRADRVVLALPFTTLREVDYRAAGFSSRKEAAIRELGMATNAKLTLQFSRKTWRLDGYDGYVETDRIPGDTWDTTVNQRGREGILVVYTGGRRGATYPVSHAHGPAPAGVARETVAQLAAIYPRLERDFTGRAHLDAWVQDPWSRGSYAAFLVGQYTRFPQHVRGGREGGVHFAGEHTDTDQQGYIDGAVRTGERAARELAA
jgi:monoamine oxidase